MLVAFPIFNLGASLKWNRFFPWFEKHNSIVCTVLFVNELAYHTLVIRLESKALPYSILDGAITTAALVSVFYVVFPLLSAVFLVLVAALLFQYTSIEYNACSHMLPPLVS